MTPPRNAAKAGMIPPLLLLIIMVILLAQSLRGVFIPLASAASDGMVELSPGFYSHNLGMDEYIVELDYPRGAVMTAATGDLVFNLTMKGNHTMIQLYIPPEFSFTTPDTRSVWTSITNDYRYISLGRAGRGDRVAPGWWEAAVKGVKIPEGTHLIRLFNVSAPEVQGRYFFKVFIDGESIGADKFPTLVVKGGLEPAYISGRVLPGGLGGGYGGPLNVSGKVTAVGTTLDGRTVSAQAYFNASAAGSYILYGLAAGTYELTASAAGFAPTKLRETVTVMPGQSLMDVDIYLKPGVRIDGAVWSKCEGGLQPWGMKKPIEVELLDSEGEPLGSVKGNVSSDEVCYEFSIDRIQLDGHIPQDYADYVSGIEDGLYLLEAHIAGYLQGDIVALDIFGQRGVRVGIDLFKAGRIEVTVHFTDPNARRGAPLPSDRSLSVSVYGMDGSLKGRNSTMVPSGSLNWTLEVSGLPGGTYLVEASMKGYVQQAFPFITISGCGAVGGLSIILVEGGSADITIRSVDWEEPLREIGWAHPGAPIRVELYNPSGEFIIINATQPPPPETAVAVNVTGLSKGLYFINVYTLGYVQAQAYSFSVSLGCTTTLSICVIKGVKITADIVFLTEGLFSPVDTYPFKEDIPVRVEVYDQYWNLAGANITHIPETISFNVEISGFKQYAGDAAHRWINYYDTTNGVLQLDYGLPPGTYMIRVWVPGYLQEGGAAATPPPSGLASITIRLNRLAHISGVVQGLNFFGDLSPLSWAQVTAFNDVVF
ncbi:MAG: carboxypeptidase-like regulatory domain-containing protein, partial [Candidatus Bathyarchaeia archaeon]